MEISTEMEIGNNNKRIKRKRMEKIQIKRVYGMELKNGRNNGRWTGKRSQEKSFKERKK